MARDLLLKTVELGSINLHLIYCYGDQIEPQWIAVQGSVLASLLTKVPLDLMDHALKGWTSPLVKSLGISPEGALRKLPTSKCFQRVTCPFHNKVICNPIHKKMPWCFEPELKGVEERKAGSELIRLWRGSVYIVIVVHPDTHNR